MIYIIIILIMIIIYQFYNNKKDTEKKDIINYNEKYEKKEFLLTPTELKFYKVLKLVTDELSLVICPQVSLYEIIKNKNYKDFNKISRKTIDFVITEQNLKIKLCIELDDYTHNQPKRIERDKFINELLNSTGIKILRIQVQNYYNLEELKIKIEELL